jgi:hypothetical protein
VSAKPHDKAGGPVFDRVLEEMQEATGASS